MNSKTHTAKLQLIISMFIFGTIGIFRKYIPDIPSSLLAMIRGFVGVAFLLVVILLQKRKLSKEALKKNLLLLIISGIFIGFNWIFLFESYNYTSVAISTLCYYMAPVIVIVLSPFVLKDKVSIKQWCCVAVAIVGMVLVSGVFSSGDRSVDLFKGVGFGLAAALLYALVILLNKKINGISPYDKTICQLGSAAIVLLPYVLLTEDIGATKLDPKTIIILLIVGIVHTGITYFLYFGSLSNIDAQTAALYSYIDPIVAIILSAVILGEKPDLFTVIGTVLILGSTIICEIPFKSLKKKV